MRITIGAGAVLIISLLTAFFPSPVAQAQSTAPAATSPSSLLVDLSSGWTLLKEGQGGATIEADARHPTNSDPHLLKIAVTKYPGLGEGRAGAKNSHTFPIKEGQLFDITFTGISEGIGVGLVFSLENAQGQVLARTTLPEIGRGGRGGGRGRGGAAQITGPVWRPYLVNLQARGSDPAVHVVITPIEPVPVWLDGLTLVERKPGQ